MSLLGLAAEEAEGEEGDGRVQANIITHFVSDVALHEGRTAFVVDSLVAAGELQNPLRPSLPGPAGLSPTTRGQTEAGLKAEAGRLHSYEGQETSRRGSNKGKGASHQAPKGAAC